MVPWIHLPTETSPPEESQDVNKAAEPPKSRFLSNLIWSGVGVAVNLFSGFILSPYIIRKLGLEGYGLWALVFSVTGYFNLVDLGFRSAVIRYSAYYRARGEFDKLNALINTTFTYFSSVSVALIVLTLFAAPSAGRWFNVSPEYAAIFPKIALLIGITLATGVAFNAFSGCVEGFQRFDISNGIWVAAFLIRHPGCALLLWLGYGLPEMSMVVLGTQIALCLGYAVACKRIFPQLRFGLRYFDLGMLKRTASFGIHTFIMSLSTMSLDLTPSLLIGRLQSVEQLGFYNLPLRLLQYAADGVSRIGLIVAPRAAELAATDQKHTIARLAVLANRYSLVLYLPLSIFLLNFGPELLRVWLRERGPEVAAHSAPLLPILLAGSTLALAAQFSSSTVLVGLGRHKAYSWSVACEAVASVVLMYFLLPPYGIFGAAIIASSLMLGVRGLLTPWLVSKVLEISLLSYLSDIYTRALLAAAPVWLLAFWLRKSVLDGHNWSQLFLAAGIIGILYYTLAFFFCLADEHQDKLTGMAKHYLGAAGGRA